MTSGAGSSAGMDFLSGIPSSIRYIRLSAFQLAAYVLLLYAGPLVVLLLAFREGDVQLGVALRRDVEARGDYREPLGLDGLREMPELAPCEQQLAVAHRLVAAPRRSPEVGGDIHSAHIQLPAREIAVGILERGLAGADRLDLRAHEDYAGVVLFEELVFERGLLVVYLHPALFFPCHGSVKDSGFPLQAELFPDAFHGIELLPAKELHPVPDIGLAAHVAVGGTGLVNGILEGEAFDYRSRTHVEQLPYPGGDIRVGLLSLVSGNGSRAVGVDEDADGFRDPDRIRHLHQALLGSARRDEVLGDMPCRICRRTVDLGGVLAGERSAAVRPASAVGIHDYLASGKPGVARGAAYDELARGVDMQYEPVVEQGRGP